MPTKKCKRGHAFTKANTYKQTNRWKNKAGTKRVRVVDVCRLCARGRFKANKVGRPLRDRRFAGGVR